ncbi:nucleoside triphosphate pyrophosphohydrolase [bacterium]|nr:nucleoside triphosphate pyrophosphohydrolase [candidate division CSSED10-310 bacterium]
MNANQTCRIFCELLEIMQRLRSDHGCPWDKQQNHNSLKPYIIEEAYELVDAINVNRIDEIVDELGDILLQVIFHAQIGSENHSFDINDVINAIRLKLLRRHPHVFGDVTVKNAEEVVTNWQDIKRNEKGRDSQKNDAFGDIPSVLPQLAYAYKCQKRAAEYGFDWSKIQDVFEKVNEEWSELQEEISLKSNSRRMEEELGDLLFAIVNLSRFLDIHPEEALRSATAKFKRRFNRVKDTANGLETMKTMSLEELDQIWNQVKMSE